MNVRLPQVVLPADLARYRDHRPTKNERRLSKIDGSGMELQIVSALKRSGASDEEVFAYFDHYELPRYVEEGRSRPWLQSLIDTSAKTRKSKASGDTKQHPRVIENEHNRQKQSYADGVLVYFVLRRRAQQEEEGRVPILTQWRKEIIEVSSERETKPISLATARRMSDALIERRYVRLEPLNRKSKLVYLTTKGMRASEPVRGQWGRFIHLWPPPERAPSPQEDPAAADPRQAVAREGEPPVEAQDQTAVKPRSRRPTSRKKTRATEIATLRKNRQINGYHRLRFKGNKIRYIQLLTPPEKWAEGSLWVQYQVRYDEHDLPAYVTVLAERDREDPVAKIVPHGWGPTTSSGLAAAVELEKTDTGFRAAEYVDEHGQPSAAAGVIVESSATFFGPLLAQPFGQILSVRGTRSGRRRRYSFSPVAETLMLDNSFDFDSLLRTIDDTHTRDRLLDLPSGWFYMPEKRKLLVQHLLEGSAPPT